MLHDHDISEKYVHAVVSRNERLDGIQGAVLGVKLPHLDTWNTARRSHVKLYRALLSTETRIQLFDAHSDRESNYHLFVVRVQNRDAVQAKLKEKRYRNRHPLPDPRSATEIIRRTMDER